MSRLTIAIDGPVASGKSTVARRVAELLGYTYLDSGAMYRALGLKALRSGVPLDAPEGLVALARETRIDLEQGADGLHIRLDGEDVTAAIRTPEASHAASRVAIVPGVRQVLVAEQQRAGAAGGVVMEGRDIGSVVFPRAELKIYLDASPEVRAARRWREYQGRGEPVAFETLLEELRARDRRDTQRDASPLARAPDAVLVDSTALGVEEVARLIVLLAREREGAPRR